MNTNKHTRRRFTTGETITFKHSVRLVPSVRCLVLCAKDFCWLDTKLTSHNDTVLYITHVLSLSLSRSLSVYITHTHADTHAMHSQLFVKGSRMLAKVETINHRMIICCYRGSQQKPSQQQKILHTQSHKCHMIPPILP